MSYYPSPPPLSIACGFVWTVIALGEIGILNLLQKRSG